MRHLRFAKLGRNKTYRSIRSSILVKADMETLWRNITEVKIDGYKAPTLLRILDIPKPISAEIISEGKGGKRVAVFDNGKRFEQEILTWLPFHTYSFAFNPERNFRVGYFFDLHSGVFQIPSGSYDLAAMNGSTTRLQLETTYSIDSRWFGLFNPLVCLVLTLFQNHLLTSIRKNSE